MGKHLVLCGAGHAHLTALIHIPEYINLGHRVTVVNSSPHHYYSGMGPGLLSGIYQPQDIRFNVKKMVENRGGVFVEDTIESVRADRQAILLQSGLEIDFDVASFNIGSWIPPGLVDLAATNILTVKPIENFLIARRRIVEIAENGRGASISFVVVGGGAAGVESACNLWRVLRDMGSQGSVTLVSGRKILKRFSTKLRIRALRSMRRRGVTVIEGVRVASNTADTIHLSDKREIPFDLALLATGVRPSKVFEHSQIPIGPDGGLLVNEHLHSVRYPHLFGGGDCISFKPRPLDKVGVYAVRQNQVLVDNLTAALTGGKLRPFSPQKSYMQLLNMGDGTALFNNKIPLPGNRFAFHLKDRIDRAFMRKFQLSGEQDEGVGGS